MSRKSSESGFTLIETSIAMVIMMISALGAASLFSFTVYNNTGGSDRAQALALAQQRLEILRSARFSSADTESDTTWILRAGTTTQSGVTTADGRRYNVVTTIENTTATLKNIAVSVTPQGAGHNWATGAGGTVMIRTWRARTR